MKPKTFYTLMYGL